MRIPTAALCIVAASSLLSACSFSRFLDPYLVDVRQGNYVTQDMVAQLRPGMSRDQVRFALGTPLLTDMFHGERWDYVYRFKPGKGELQQRHLSVFFEDGKLARVGGDVVASSGSAQPDEPAQPASRVIEIENPKAPKADGK